MGIVNICGYFDMHHHLLYGLDDGPMKRIGMEKMIDAAAADHIGTIIATPHVSPGINPFDFQAYNHAIECANEYCADKGYPVKIYGGSEILYTDAALRFLQDKKIPTMNKTKFVLVEWKNAETINRVTEGVRELRNEGYIPIIAHVERLKCFRHRIDRLTELKETFDMRIQVDCEAIVAKQSIFYKTYIDHIFDAGLPDYVATDAYNLSSRRACMSETYRVLCQNYGKKYATQLVLGNQRELLMAMEG